MRRTRALTSMTILALTGAAGLAIEPPATTTTPQARAAEREPAMPVLEEAHIDVVFVLDTTGSMGGLIEAAKQKIWSIANVIATAEPRPTIRLGLVGYRDLHDEYVTVRTDLTGDLDAIYEQLMGYVAAGGGDTPESVNQALHEAVTMFDWTEGDDALKLIYLVGDAPPHMDYEQDVSYVESCSKAASSGIIINTIQCGAMQATTPIWQEIARGAEGEYVAIDQSGGAVAIATPFDEALARCGTALTETFCAYGEGEALRAQQAKVRSFREIESRASDEALADRACYMACDAGVTSLVGGQELVHDVTEGKVALEEIPEDQLPEEIRDLSLEAQRAWIDERASERERLRNEIQDLTAKRDAHIKAELEKQGVTDSFDARVKETLRRQAATRGVTLASND